MEVVPRALGSRSILGDARSTKMQSVMNRKIKFRESFRPFAPIVLREHVSDWFDMRPEEDSPYMLLVAQVADQRLLDSRDKTESPSGLDRVHKPRSTIPAVTHVDNSARVQTVDAERNPLLHQLLSCFHEQTGCPVMINTSFNVRSEPIVCTPADAYRCFQMTDMDVLVLGRHIVLKEQQKELPSTVVREEYLAHFPPD